MQYSSDIDLEELESQLYSQVYHSKDDLEASIGASIALNNLASNSLQLPQRYVSDYSLNNVMLPNAGRYWCGPPNTTYSLNPPSQTYNIPSLMSLTPFDFPNCIYPLPNCSTSTPPNTSLQIYTNTSDLPNALSDKRVQNPLNPEVRRRRKKKQKKGKRAKQTENTILSVPNPKDRFSKANIPDTYGENRTTRQGTYLYEDTRKPAPLNNFANTHFLDSVLKRTNHNPPGDDDVIVLSDEGNQSDSDGSVVEIPLPPKPPIPTFSVESSDEDESNSQTEQLQSKSDNITESVKESNESEDDEKEPNEKSPSSTLTKNPSCDSTKINQPNKLDVRATEKERTELLCTPDSNTNDFIENDVQGLNGASFNFQLHGLDMDLNNKTPQKSTNKTPADAFETESTCSEATSTLKEPQFEDRNKQIFAEPDLATFSNLITPIRDENTSQTKTKAKAKKSKEEKKKVKKKLSKKKSEASKEKKLSKKSSKECNPTADISVSEPQDESDNLNSELNDTAISTSSYKDLENFSFIKAWDEIKQNVDPEHETDQEEEIDVETCDNDPQFEPPNKELNNSVIVLSDNENSIDIFDVVVDESGDELLLNTSLTNADKKEYNERFSAHHNLVPNPINILNMHKRWSFRDYWTDDMKRFYDDSWGQENYDMEKVQSNMSSESSKWEVVSQDRFNTFKSFRTQGPACKYCKERGHSTYACPKNQGPIVCSICGNTGHRCTRCPNVMCTTCGNKGSYLTTSCRKCAHYNHIKCVLCKSAGHVERNCPDLWRRYHLTTQDGQDLTKSQEKLKPVNQRWCPNCAQRGHLHNNCTYLRSEHFPTNPEIISYIATYDNAPNFLPSITNDYQIPMLQNARLSHVRNYKNNLIASNKKKALNLRQKYQKSLQKLKIKCKKFNPDLIGKIESFERRLAMAVKKPEFDKKERIKAAFVKLRNRIEWELP